MKIFIDTAHKEEIQQAYNAGFLDGVTTNPSLMKRAVDTLKEQGKKIDLESYITDILQTAKGTPVSLEVTKSDYEGMVKEGENLFNRFNPVAENVYIKIPINPSFDKNNRNFDGVKAIKELTAKNIPINTTLIFSPEQALMAAKAGAKIVSPFAGRIDDLLRNNADIEFDKHDYYYPHIPVHGHGREKPAAADNGRPEDINDEGIVSGVDLVSEIVDIFNYHDIQCDVLAASVRNRRQLKELALVGADIATVPFSIIESSLSHRKTQEGMKKFTQDVVAEYEQLGKRTM